MNSKTDVRAFYEQMPYPLPAAKLELDQDLYGDPDRARAFSHLLWPDEAPRNDRSILIAGCGTSQAVRYALREPQARITAIDISETSLGHARELQARYKLQNLEFHRLSITDVGTLGRTFDQIVCTGVLHHLPDPVLGLQSLHDVLQPEGAMQIMVYARYGRTGIYMIQEYCRLLGITSSAQDLDNLGATLKTLPQGHPLTSLMHRVKDFTNPDGLADALLNPQDRAYTVPEIHDWLDRCGMSFGRWVEQAPYLPQCGVVAKTPHAAQLAALPEPRQHAAVELFRGTIAQHNFVAYRKDRSRPSQPISFAVEQWRKYIPLRLPWTLCVRERVPAGYVAVLLNPAHRHAEFALPLDAVRADLLEMIDGARTLGEIAHDSRASCSAAVVRDFFWQLWRYDQVVFATSQIHCAEPVASR
jgi:SAM-dependent methyltransferase